MVRGRACATTTCVLLQESCPPQQLPASYHRTRPHHHHLRARPRHLEPQLPQRARRRPRRRRLRFCRRPRRLRRQRHRAPLAARPRQGLARARYPPPQEHGAHPRLEPHLSRLNTLHAAARRARCALWAHAAPRVALRRLWASKEPAHVDTRRPRLGPRPAPQRGRGQSLVAP